MRLSDQEKKYKSYVVVWNANKQVYELKGEYWNPGYTAAHKATPLEAVNYEINKARNAKIAAEQRASLMYKMKSDIEKAEATHG